MGSRIETDSMGTIEVADDALWGAQTQRSLQNFRIGAQRFPRVFIHAFAQVKKAAVLANAELGVLPADLAVLVTAACDEILAGQHDDQFPLMIWQTGSGTQTNMNLNEVIANRANQLAGQPLGTKSPVHPNDHVNLSQSSNDVFPTVMNIACLQWLQARLLPAVDGLLAALESKTRQFHATLKIGRTHMMDATPLSLGQEFSGYYNQVAYASEQIRQGMMGLQALAIGGTAVGTGINTPPGWPVTVTRHLSNLTGLPWHPTDNTFMALAGHEAITDLHGRLRLLATSLFKMANDLRLMASGPRCGLAEIYLPANEPGSSIMPGKVNPTQIEALCMVALQVMGNDVAVSMANSQGQFELNTYKPLIIHNVLESITLLGDAIASFTQHCLAGIEANDEQLQTYVGQSLMLVTALSPVIGYDQAARAVALATHRKLPLKQAVMELGLLGEVEFDRIMQEMISPAADRH